MTLKEIQEQDKRIENMIDILLVQKIKEERVTEEIIECAVIDSVDMIDSYDGTDISPERINNLIEKIKIKYIGRED